MRKFLRNWLIGTAAVLIVCVALVAYVAGIGYLGLFLHHYIADKDMCMGLAFLIFMIPLLGLLAGMIFSD